MVLNRLLPPALDNASPGRKAALWILGLLLFLKGAMGLHSILNGQQVASMADGLPLDSFSPAGASAVITFLAVWGWEILLWSLLGLLVLVRYRAMVPLMFLLLMAEQIGRRLIFASMPIAGTSGSPGFSMNMAICALALAGFVLSLWPRKQRETA